MEEDQDIEMEEETSKRSKKKDVYLPGDPLDEEEELVMDESAYEMYHEAQTGAPCLSFDILRDNLGENRTAFPHTCYIVCGTQAPKVTGNRLIVMKMSNLVRTYKENDNEDSDEDDDEDEDDEYEKPNLEVSLVPHPGGVNRIRAAMVGDVHLAASWSELGHVYIWNLTKQLQAVDTPASPSVDSLEPQFAFKGHMCEGYAVDWSPLVPGVLATGDCNKNIHIWRPASGGWHVDQRPLIGHSTSVEDIQWSPTENSVLASCSVDRTIRIWDTNSEPHKACKLTAAEAHDRDINVISWNRNDAFILSGGDDGVIKIWDLRRFKSGEPVAVFKHHTSPITSVEWNPKDSTVFAASGSDDQVTLWDLSVERETEEQIGHDRAANLPPQLLFIHQGQSDIKELHWHQQIPGVIISTAHSGFNVFKTISV